MTERKEGRQEGWEKHVYSIVGPVTHRTIFNPRGSAAATHPHKTGGQGLGIVAGPTFLSDFLPYTLLPAALVPGSREQAGHRAKC